MSVVITTDGTWYPISIVRDYQGYIEAYIQGTTASRYRYRGNDQNNPSSFPTQESMLNGTYLEDGKNIQMITTSINGQGYSGAQVMGSDLLRINTIDTSTDTTGSDSPGFTYSEAGPSIVQFVLDSNGVIHFFYKALVSNMGNDYNTLMYANKVGGTWNTPVEIWGAAAQEPVGDYEVYIDNNNIPIIAYKLFSSAHTKFAKGNANNATSFSSYEVSTLSAMQGYTPLTNDANNNSYIVQYLSGYIRLYKNTNGDAYNVWTSTDLGSGSLGITSSSILQSVLIGTDLYVFFISDTNNAGKVSWVIIDVSTTTPTIGSPVFSALLPISLTSPRINQFGRIWSAKHHVYDSTLTDVGNSGNREQIDFLIKEGNNIYWERIDLTTPANNVSKIKVTAWKDWAGGQINIGGTWKTINAVKINIGGVWKDADITP